MKRLPGLGARVAPAQSRGALVKRSSWAAWGLACLAVVLHLFAHLFVILGIGVSSPGDADAGFGAVGYLIAFYTFPLVGVVIAIRRPEHAIGWLFLAAGVAFGLSDLGASYADYALFTNPGLLPAGNWAAWSVAWLDPLFFVFVILLVLLFPEGQLPSRRWRPVLATLLAAGVTTMVCSAIKPGVVFDTSLPVENPAGISGVESIRNGAATVASFGFLVTALLAFVGTFLRFRRAEGVERQQFKWFAFAVCFLLGVFLLLAVASVGFLDHLTAVLNGIGFAGLAVAVGIAILRYRLYDIDRVISKTLVYGALTLILGAAYAGLVLAGQAVFASFAGGSNLAIAVSTLVVAALFLPLRSRVQRFVDQRFYRRRYDSQHTLNRFGARLRGPVELDTLRTDLQEVVRDTMQPAHVSLWLRKGTR